ncbi:MAG: hypothetical protein K2J79_08900 [Ruminiclostridium sp.]|nr:hypothetical protein [Ruminiclostridium sp.]
MKETLYTVVHYSNGKRKIYRTETYLLLRRLKFISAIAGAITVSLLLCGMTMVDDCPTMPLQIVALLGLGIIVLILLICAYVSDKEPCEKQEKSRGKKR